MTLETAPHRAGTRSANAARRTRLGTSSRRLRAQLQAAEAPTAIQDPPPPQGPPAVRLELLLGEAREGLETVGTRETVVLGRGWGADLVLNDRRVSRLHCRIDWTGDGFQITDLDSSNGTFVNGARTRRSPLLDQDVIRVGGSVLRLSLAAPRA